MPNLLGDYLTSRFMQMPCLRADVSYFLCCTRKTKEIVACGQALLFGRAKRAARSREVRFACPNRRVCPQAKEIGDVCTQASKCHASIYTILLRYT